MNNWSISSFSSFFLGRTEPAKLENSQPIQEKINNLIINLFKMKMIVIMLPAIAAVYFVSYLPIHLINFSIAICIVGIVILGIAAFNYLERAPHRSLKIDYKDSFKNADPHSMLVWHDYCYSLHNTSKIALDMIRRYKEMESIINECEANFNEGTKYQEACEAIAANPELCGFTHSWRRPADKGLEYCKGFIKTLKLGVDSIVVCFEVNGPPACTKALSRAACCFQYSIEGVLAPLMKNVEKKRFKPVSIVERKCIPEFMTNHTPEQYAGELVRAYVHTMAFKQLKKDLRWDELEGNNEKLFVEISETNLFKEKFLSVEKIIKWGIKKKYIGPTALCNVKEGTEMTKFPFEGELAKKAIEETFLAVYDL